MEPIVRALQTYTSTHHRGYTVRNVFLDVIMWQC